MNKYKTKFASLMLAAALGTASLPLAAEPANAAIAAMTSQELQEAIQELSRLGIIHGYQDGTLRMQNNITRAELAKLVALTFGLESSPASPAQITDTPPSHWSFPYAAALTSLDIMKAEDGVFDPSGSVTNDELVQIVAKVLKRDVKSVQYWAEPFFSRNHSTTRGEAAFLLDKARQAIPSANANITSVRALNAITLIVTFDAPLTAENEAFAQAKADFAFTNGLTLTNMPRLKTGSIATYIVPTSVQQPGTSYTLAYKGKDAGSFTGNANKLDMTEVRQVANDTFELEALKENGVVDYGYVISAYSAGRGENAFILDDNNRADGVEYRIISSGQAREVTITPEGGQPITAKYVPFTQSTDGKQEPKFRLPEGIVLKPGITYTVTSDWANIASPTFVAKEMAPLQIDKAEAASETSIVVTLAEDPGDELFSGRSVELTDAEGNKRTAAYKYSSRKGAAGVFELAQGSKLTAGTTYVVTPVGEWAGESEAELTVAP